MLFILIFTPPCKSIYCIASYVCIPVSLYMTVQLAVDITDGNGLNNEADHELHVLSNNNATCRSCFNWAYHAGCKA